MEINTYISSGILETYVLGLCTADEIREVERMMLAHAEVRAEVDAIRMSLESYAGVMSKTPPPALKNKIWEAIDKENPVKETKVIPFRKTDQVSKWLVAASFILLAIAAAMNVFLYNKWKSAERQIAEIQSEKEFFASQVQTGQTQLASLKEELQFVQNPGTKTVFMKGTGNFPNALATVFWNSATKEVFLKVNNMPEAPAGKQYQLWAIVDGAPVNAGMVEIADAQFQKMENFSTAQAFAITLEPSGGSPAPHLEALYVIGNI